MKQELSAKEKKLVKQLVRLEKENLEATRLVVKEDQPSAYEKQLQELSKKLAVCL